MLVSIPQESQQQIDHLRIDLAQAVVDLAQVQTPDNQSRRNKEKVIEGLRRVRQALDRLGIQHSTLKLPAQKSA